MPLDSEKQLLTIQQVSEKLKVPRHTLRFWESAFEGILVPLRTRGGQRRYSPEDVSIIESIRKLRRRGLGLAEIKRKVGESHACRDPNSRRAEMLASQVAEVVRAEVYNLLRREVEMGMLGNGEARSSLRAPRSIGERGIKGEESR